MADDVGRFQTNPIIVAKHVWLAVFHNISRLGEIFVQCVGVREGGVCMCQAAAPSLQEKSGGNDGLQKRGAGTGWLKATTEGGERREFSEKLLQGEGSMLGRLTLQVIEPHLERHAHRPTETKVRSVAHDALCPSGASSPHVVLHFADMNLGRSLLEEARMKKRYLVAHWDISAGLANVMECGVFPERLERGEKQD